MTAATPQLASMPAKRRYRIATASSVGAHAALVLLIGALSLRAPAAPGPPIPVELVMVAQPEQPHPAPTAVPPRPSGQPEARPTPAPLAVLAARPATRPPSSAGGRDRVAPAPPRVLTARSGKEPAGPTGKGKEATGPGGRQEEEGGPTYGPAVIGGTLPVYPKHALDQGLEGTVVVSVLVGPDGSAQSVAVAKSSGHTVLDAAAVRAVKQGWRFKGGMAKGKPVGGTATVTIIFSGTEVRQG